MGVPAGVGRNAHDTSLHSLASESAFFLPFCGQHTERKYPQSQPPGPTLSSPMPPEVGLSQVDNSLRTATSAPTFYTVGAPSSICPSSLHCHLGPHRPIALSSSRPLPRHLPACCFPVFFLPAIPSSSSHTSSPSVLHLYMPCSLRFLCISYLCIFMRSIYPFFWHVPIIN